MKKSKKNLPSSLKNEREFRKPKLRREKDPICTIRVQTK